MMRSSQFPKMYLLATKITCIEVSIKTPNFLLYKRIHLHESILGDLDLKAKKYSSYKKLLDEGYFLLVEQLVR